MAEQLRDTAEYYNGLKVVPLDVKKQLREIMEKHSPGAILVEVHSSDHQDPINKLILLVPEYLPIVFLLSRAYFKLLMKNNYVIPRLEMLLETPINNICRSHITKPELESRFSSLVFKKSSETRVTLRIMNVFNEAEYHYSNHWVTLSEQPNGSAFGAIDLDSHNEVNLKCRAQILNHCTMIEVGLTHKGKRLLQRTLLTHEVAKSDDKSKIFTFTVGDGEVLRLRFFVEASKFYYKIPKYFTDHSMQFLISKILIRISPPNTESITSSEFRDSFKHPLITTNRNNYRFNIAVPSLQLVSKSSLDVEEKSRETERTEVDSLFGEHIYRGAEDTEETSQEKKTGSQCFTEPQSLKVEEEKNCVPALKCEAVAEQSQETDLNRSEPDANVANPVSIKNRSSSPKELKKLNQSQTEFVQLPNELESTDKLPNDSGRTADPAPTPAAGLRLTSTLSPNLSHLFTSIPIFVPIVPIAPVWSNPVLINPPNNFKDRMTQLLNYYTNKPATGSSEAHAINNDKFIQDLPNRIGSW